MAEIGSKRKADEKSEEKNTPPPDAQPEEDLSNDQQAALDQIMAEIQSKRKAEDSPSTAAAEDKTPAKEQPADQDQEAALQNILNEIGAKKAANNAKIATKADADELSAEMNANGSEADKPQNDQSQARKESLSLTEFDDELNNLLSASPKTAGTKTENKEIKGSDSGSGEITPAKPTVEGQPRKDGERPKDFPILKEVSDLPPSQNGKKSKPKKEGSTKGWHRWMRKVMYAGAGMTIIIVLGASGFWAFRHFFPNKSQQWVSIWQTSAPTHEEVKTVPEQTKPAQETKPNETTDSQSSTAALPGPLVPEQAKVQEESKVELPALPPPKRQEIEPPSVMLAHMKKDLTAAHKQIQARIYDIQQLKSYYDRGIVEEIEKIEESLSNGQIPSFEKAMADKKIELSLRAMQHRQTYINKLDTPLGQLMAMTEELLYLERKTHTYEILSNGINGFPIENFKQDVANTIARFLQYNTQLSIDEVEGVPPTLGALWDRVVTDLNKKASTLAQRAPLNRAISTEICNGQYDRKYLLTALAPATAKCLIKWDGKDLYLNSLTEISPEIAEILSKWPGEWLSLNGVRELPAESAKYLAAWKGKRLSLNGLSTLSPEATACLSKWRGEQLEMVGLKSIGRWENYGTRLFLSEGLRRQLEAQLQ